MSEIQSAAGEFRELPLDLVVPSKTNPRKHFDEAYIAELSRSIADKGVVQPILVRPAVPHNGVTIGQFEIIAGECRYRGSERAGKTHIPAVVRDYTDEQVLELQLIENIHRRDLTPLEQARGYRALIDANPTKHSAETIATRIGMSIAWVWDRLKLNDLIDEAKQLLTDERMSIGHAILIARLKPEDQARVIEPGDAHDYGNRHAGGLWCEETASLLDDDENDRERTNAKPAKYDGLKAATIRELEHWINDHVRFDVKHAAVAVPLEFEDLASKVESAQAKPGRGRKVIAITFDHFTAPEARSDEERTFGPKSFKRADGTKKSHYSYDSGRLIDSPTCDHSVLGVVAAGDRRGQAFDVCIARDKCDIHWAREIKDKATRTTGSKTSGREENRAAADERREERQRQVEAAKEARFKAFKPVLEKAVNAAIDKVGEKLPRKVFAKVLAGHRLPASTKPAELQKALLRRTVSQVFSNAWQYDEPQMVAWAKLLGVDVKACEPKQDPKQPAAKRDAKG